MATSQRGHPDHCHQLSAEYLSANCLVRPSDFGVLSSRAKIGSDTHSVRGAVVKSVAAAKFGFPGLRNF